MGTAQGTVTVTPEIFHGQRMMAAIKSQSMTEALELAREGASLYPAFRLPVSGGGQPTFGEVAQTIAGKLGVPVPAPKKSGKKSGKKSAAIAAAPAQPVVQVPAEPTVVTLRIVHNVGTPTSLFDVDKDSPANKIIGSARNGGLGWAWWGDTKAFYLRGSGQFAARMDKITEAVTALEAYAGPEPVRYKVTVEINNTDTTTGQTAPVYETAAQRKLRQSEERKVREGLLNVLRWNLGEHGTGVDCATCNVKGLKSATGGGITRDESEMPRVQCPNCRGEVAQPVKAEPVAFSLDMLALPAAPVAVPAQTVKVTAPTVVPAPTVVAPDAGQAWKFKLADRSASGNRASEIATVLRRDLQNRVAVLYPGLTFEVRLDKKTRILAVTVKTPALVEVKSTILAVQVRGTGLTVAGIAA